MNIYVGNLSYQTTEDEIRQAFEGHGQISSCSIIKDKFSGESKGFGFVEMASKDEAMKAISGLNGTDMNGRTLTVSEAKPRTENRSGGNGGGYGGGNSRRNY
jgi:cold-inducible RNA-binding protein